MEQRRNIEIPSTADLVFEESVSLEPPDTKTLNIAALGGLPLTVACNRRALNSWGSGGGLIR